MMTNPAEAYESYSVPALFTPLADLLVEEARPRKGDRLVDVASGTGIVLRRAWPHVGESGRLSGVHVNPAMVAVAREIAQREGLTADFHLAPAHALPFPDASADLVLCGAGLMYFSDRVAALSEMHRIVVPGGRIVVSVLQDIGRHPFYDALFGAIQAQLGLGNFTSPFVLGDEAELRSLFDASGLDSVEVEQRTFTARFAQLELFLPAAVNTAAAGIPELQQLDEAGRDELLANIWEQMEPRVRDATVDDYVVLQVHAHIACAVRQSALRSAAAS